MLKKILFRDGGVDFFQKLYVGHDGEASAERRLERAAKKGEEIVAEGAGNEKPDGWK